jgi:hypothetical protein
MAHRLNYNLSTSRTETASEKDLSRSTNSRESKQHGYSKTPRAKSVHQNTEAGGGREDGPRGLAPQTCEELGPQAAVASGSTTGFA